MVHIKWNELSREAKLASIMGLALGIWSVPLLVVVPASGALGECEYGLCFFWLLLFPTAAFLVAAASRILLVTLNTDAAKSAVYSILVASILPVLMSLAYGIHLRYWCWPHHPIQFCA